MFKTFYYAYVYFTKLEHAKKALNEFRFPEFGGMKCRVLAFNKQQLGDNKKHESNGVFVKGFPKNWTHEDLYKVFEKFGKVFSAKVSVEDGKESRGYGFVSMETSEAMQKALEGLNDKSLEEIQF